MFIFHLIVIDISQLEIISVIIIAYIPMAIRLYTYSYTASHRSNKKKNC